MRVVFAKQLDNVLHDLFLIIYFVTNSFQHNLKLYTCIQSDFAFVHVNRHIALSVRPCDAKCSDQFVNIVNVKKLYFQC